LLVGLPCVGGVRCDGLEAARSSGCLPICSLSGTTHLFGREAVGVEVVAQRVNLLAPIGALHVLEEPTFQSPRGRFGVLL
jgi:hypothetical protein